MSLYMTDSGRPIAPQFPDDLSAWPELARAVANAQRLEREFQEAGAALLAAESALEQSVAADRARLAEARLKGRKKLSERLPTTLAVVVVRSFSRRSSGTEPTTRV